VSCPVRHGCTVDMAKKALVHYRQKQVPQKSGAWAFHCLKNELPQDARIDLREETRSAQREFKEKQAQRQPRPPSQTQAQQAALPDAPSTPPEEARPNA